MQESEIIYEVPEIIEESSTDVVEVEMYEAFQSPTTGESFNHALLNNREITDAHPITAITGLREELNSIEALQTIYSDKKGNADYYEWADGHAIGVHGVGYFVTLQRDIRTISICTGDDIFGVVVDNAAFVGGQDNVARDAHYGLVATSGAVNVRCELNVEVGDYVVSNEYGVATKSSSGRGYKVVALDTIQGVPHAVINLNISADQIDEIGAELNGLDSRMDAAEINIVSAINAANEAYNKASAASDSNATMTNRVTEALDTVDRLEDDVTHMSETLAYAATFSEQARALANSAATSAESMRNEAVEVANDTWAKTNNLIKTLEPITTWEDTQTGAKGADYLATKMQDGIATSYDVKVVEDELDVAQHAIIRNAKEFQSFMSNIDKYQVGPCSQAYGFTIEQAADVLAEGQTYYVPTEVITEEYKRANEAIEDVEDVDSRSIVRVYYTINDSNVKQYHYYGWKDSEYTWIDTDAFDEIPVYKRTFVPGYLYKWGKINGIGHYGWTTVDKNYETLDNNYETELTPDQITNKVNTSAKSVYFSNTEIAISKTDTSNDYGYWYTNVSDADQTIYALDDKGAAIATTLYKPYTLYKWDDYKTIDEEGNEVTDWQWVRVDALADNPTGRAVSQIRQDANSIEMRVMNAEGSYAGLSAELDNNKATVTSLSNWKNGKDSNKAIIRQETADDSASIVIAALTETEKEDGTTEIGDMAKLVLNVVKDGDGNPTSSLSIGADYINLNGAVTANNNVQISTDGKIIAVGGEIGGWTIDSDLIHKGSSGMGASSSACRSDNTSPPRFYAGEHTVTVERKVSVTPPSFKPEMGSQSFSDTEYICLMNELVVKLRVILVYKLIIHILVSRIRRWNLH